jgi:hypothetical protein
MQAVRAAKIVSRPLVLERPGSVVGIDSHTANRIDRN